MFVACIRVYVYSAECFFLPCKRQYVGISLIGFLKVESFACVQQCQLESLISRISYALTPCYCDNFLNPSWIMTLEFLKLEIEWQKAYFSDRYRYIGSAPTA